MSGISWLWICLILVAVWLERKISNLENETRDLKSRVEDLEVEAQKNESGELLDDDDEYLV